jgi:hypothetical protein
LRVGHRCLHDGASIEFPVMAGLVNLQHSHSMVGQEGGQMN